MASGPGDRVAVMDVNTSVHFEAYFATARLDAVYVPLNFRGHGEEVGYPLRHSSPKVIVAGERYAPLIAGLGSEAASASVFAVDSDTPARRLALVRTAVERGRCGRDALSRGVSR